MKNKETDENELEEVRVVALLLMFKQLSSKERWSLLGGILSYKSKAVAELTNFLKQRNTLLQVSQSSTDVAFKSKKNSANASTSKQAESSSAEELSKATALMRRAKHNLLSVLPVTGGVFANPNSNQAVEFNKK
jgi:hypothetical protein